MKVLIIKMTSMGDIIHTFPALTDAGIANPSLRFDWVVENAFKELPAWHPFVENVIPIALRQWRKKPFSSLYSGIIFETIKQLRQQKYDLVIDVQGLLKSSIVSLFTRGTRWGFDRKSSKENWANFIYQKTVFVSKNQHAVQRNREFFSKILTYPLLTTEPNYGLNAPTSTLALHEKSYVVFLPNTTWQTKLWPDMYWQQLITLTTNENYNVIIPWGTLPEKLRVEQLAGNNPKVTVLPRMSLTEISTYIANAKAVVAVDTGLAHVAAAFNVPTVSLYGPTHPELTGTIGANQKMLAAKFECAPCFKSKCRYNNSKPVNPPCFHTITPEIVWQELVNSFSS